MRIMKVGVNQAEGRTDDPRLGRTFWFKSVKKAERHLEQVPRPERGYNKHDVFINYSGGNSTRARYDHGLQDDSLKKQLKYQGYMWRR